MIIQQHLYDHIKCNGVPKEVVQKCFTDPIGLKTLGTLMKFT